MPGETISCHFVLTNVIINDITTVMISYWIDSVFTLEIKTSASCRVSLICTSPGISLAMPFFHSFHLLLQMKTVEECHCKSYTRASADHTHPAGCRGFEFKSKDRVNPVWNHDSRNIITENVGKDKMTWDCFSWHARLELLCS